MKAKTSTSGVLLAMCALAIIAIAWGTFFAPSVRGRYPVAVKDRGNGQIIVAARAPEMTGIAIGDAVDFSHLTFGDRLRLQIGHATPGTALTIRVRHAGRWSDRTVVAKARPINWQTTISTLFALTVGELVVGLIALRRPTIATAALVFAAANPIPSEAAVAQFSWLPDPLFSVVAVTMLVTITNWPAIALVPFITRFPNVPTSRSGRRIIIVGDAAFWTCGVLSFIRFLPDPVFLSSWTFFDNASTTAIATVCWIFALLAYLRVHGEDRRRIGWVIVGYAFTALGSLFFNVLDENYLISGWTNPLIPATLDLLVVTQIAFPIALAYAVLRHRVLDLGFVINRGLVYTIVTLAVVVVVSLVDWLSGRLISESRLALAIEALVTVSLGVALNGIHARIESLVERVFFRTRHIAERKLKRAIDALAFATTQAAIDIVITSEAAEILGLRSATVFRLGDAGSFIPMQVAHGTDVPAPLDENSVVVRTIRAEERVVYISDLPAHERALPLGPDGPILAVPIVARHALVGIAVYGALEDGTAPDPELTELLAKLCAAAAAASLAVQASELQLQLDDLRERFDMTRLPQQIA